MVPGGLRPVPEAGEAARKIGDPYLEAKSYEGLAATVLALKGKFAARIHWRQALDLFDELGVPEAQSVAIGLEIAGE